MILIIDTTRRADIRVGVMVKKLLTLRRQFDRPGSHLVPLIDELLAKNDLRVRDLTGVIVATGPGPFSALRSGVSVANALGVALNIPVVGLEGEFTLKALLAAGQKKLSKAKIGNIVAPTYGQAPNITKSKKR